MSYTTLRQPQGQPAFMTSLIQEAIIGEIVAINDYSEHIATSDIKEINELWEHILEDEKRHYGMLLEILRKYDPVQFNKFQEVKQHIQITGYLSSEMNHKPHHNQDLILNKVRSDIKGELEAIILYEQHFTQIPNKDVKDVFFEIIGDEKEHVEELTLVLLHYDPQSYGPIDNY